MPGAAGIRVSVLGPISAGRADSEIQLGGPKQRVVLALLATRAGSVVSAAQLVAALWGERPPATAATALQGHISQLRRLLGVDSIATRDPGYVLEADVDAAEFERLAQGARDQPPAERLERLRAALGLWRGPAFADVVGQSTVFDDIARRLDELVLNTREDLFETELALGRHVELLAELEAFVRADPTRERAVALLMLALYRAGRQADALAAYRRLRAELSTTLAIEPTPALRDLERQILVQDPALAPPAVERPERPRRLPITVAAVRLPTSDDAEPEVYAETTARAREAVRLLFEAHGALVERAGSAVVGLFGAPTPADDDATRALGAARAAVGAIDGSRAGVASGEAIGAESIAVEQALRLMAEAPANGVRADALTETRARPRDLLLDRGIAGRAEELHRLLGLFDDCVARRRSALAVLVGPPGIGKTRLAEELAVAVTGRARVLRARCLSYGDGVGLLPAAELVRAAAGLPLDATAEAVRARLATLVGDDDRAAAAVEQLLDVLGLADEPADGASGWAVRRLLEAAGTPTVVLLDDLHWAAPAFRDVVERLAEPSDAPLLVVATSRETASLPALELRLRPLEPDACAEIVAEMLGGAVAEATLARLAERSGGNPLFLEELVHDLRAAGRLAIDDVWHLDESDLTLPQSLRSVLAMRIERLPDDARDLLARCSVLGTPFTLEWLRQLADGPTEAPLETLIEAHLLQSAAGAYDLEFRHGLIRDAAYASLPLGSRAELHTRVAAMLDGQLAKMRGRDALAVHHLDQALRARSTLRPGDPALDDEVEIVADRSHALAHSLLAQGDASAASSLLERVLELDAERTLARIELGRARYDAGELAAAEDAWSLGDDARSRVGRIELRLHTDADCDLEASQAEIDDLILALLDQDDDEGVAEALLARAYVSLTRGRIAELGETLDRALELAQRAGRSRAEAEMLFLACGASWYGPQPVADGIRWCEDVLQTARERPIVEAAALQALGVLRAMNGEPDLGRATVAASREIRRDIGQALGAAASAIDAGLVEMLAGEYALAEAVLREGYGELARLGETGYFSTLAGLLACAVEAQGRLDEARALARSAADAAAIGDAASHVSWRVAEARALNRLGETAASEAMAREAIAIADATDFSLLRAHAWAALGDADVAFEILERKGLSPSATGAWTRLAIPEATGRPTR